MIDFMRHHIIGGIMKSFKDEVYAIDARMIEESGIGTYIRMMLRTGRYSVALGNEEKIKKYDDNIIVIPFQEKIYGIKEQIKYPCKRLKENGVTILHSPHYNVPLFWNRKLIVTIHDLIHLKFPQYLPCKGAYLYALFVMKFACVRANKIFTVSEFTKQDLQQTLHAQKDKIEVTYNTVEECFKKRNREETGYLREKYNIPEENKIVLYVGNIKPHKNLPALVRAFLTIRREDVNLVLVGKQFDKNIANTLLTGIKKKNKIILTGAVLKDELIDWYNLADVFVFPSLYEGFGVPPLEAMACGTPVVCSTAASIPEIVGEAAIMVNPRDDISIRNGIEKVLFTMSYQDKQYLIQRGYERVSLFKNY